MGAPSPRDLGIGIATGAGGALGFLGAEAVFGGGDDGYGLRYAGNIPIDQLNPELASIYHDRQSQLDKFRPILEESLNQDTYDARVRRARDQADTATLNSYSRLGLAGSSAAIGASGEAQFRSEESIRNNRINDIIRGIQAEQGIQNNLRADLLGAQSGFNQFQNMELGQYLAGEQRDAQLVSSLIGAGATLGGFMLAGPVGGLAAGSLAGGMGSAAAPAAGSYNPNFFNEPYNSSLGTIGASNYPMGSYPAASSYAYSPYGGGYAGGYYG